MSIERLLSLLIALACLLMLVRLALGHARRARLAQGLRSRFQAWRPRALWRGRAARQAADQAARDAAQEAIERARRASRAGEVVREGNVYKPEAFKGPRKPH